MPAAIGVAVLGALGGGSLLGGGIFAGSAAGLTAFGISLPLLVGTAIFTGASIAVQILTRPKPPKPSDGIQTKRAGVQPRVGGYGRTRLSGAYVLYEVATDDRSVDVVALLSGKMTNIKSYYLHDDVVTLSAGIVQGLPDGRYGGDLIRIDTRLGLDTETVYSVSSTLLSTIWTTDYTGDGVASLELSCISPGANDFTKRYPSGLPEPSVVADLYALWDPRDPAQDPDDPATWVNYSAWSDATTYGAGARVLYQGVVYISSAGGNTNNIPDETPHKWVCVWQNPVLQIVDYLINADHGMGLDRARLIDPVIDALMDEADLCDVQVATKAGSTEPRYRSSGTWTFDTDPAGVLANPLAACDGWCVENGDGTLALQVGVYRAPTIRIDYKHVLGFGVSYGVADEDLVNELPITFTSPGFNYRETPGEPWRNEASIAQAGRVRSRNLDLPWVQSFSQARRLAKRAMHRLQAPLRGSIVTDLYGLAALGERYITINYPVIDGLDEAVVELQNAKVDFQSGRVSFDWILIDAATIDAWTPASEEGTAPVIPDAAEDVTLPVPQNVTIEPQGDGSTGLVFIAFDDLERPDLLYTVRSRLTNDGTGNPGEWSRGDYDTFETAGGRTTLTVNGSTDWEVEFQVASRGTRNALSDWSASAFFVTTTLALLAEDDSFLLAEDGSQLLTEEA